MSLLTALNTGVSGLRSFGDSLQVISDNIANVNTVAFKASRAEFADMISQTINGSAGNSQLGRGVELSQISTSFEQGSLSSTDRLTDLAINGNGYFMVQKDGINYFTRNGQFSINSNGELINPQGMNVQGYQYDSTGKSLGTIGSLRFSNSTVSPKKTGDGTDGTGVTIHANLDSSSEIKTFNVADASATSNFSTSINVYDSLGSSHTVHVYFNKTAANTWAWHGVIDGGEVGGTAGTPVERVGGTLVFTSSGALSDVTTNAPPAPNGFNFTGTEQVIGFNFGDPTTDGGTGLDGTTQFSTTSSISAQSQDGLPAGTLSSVQIGSDGTLSGVYSNGSTVAIGKIALANFTNLNGLFKSGSGLYQETLASGVAVVGTADTGGLGTISSYSLELSNVDLAKEFVDMISTQRAYQANSRTITVGDQMLSDLINVIR